METLIHFMILVDIFITSFIILMVHFTMYTCVQEHLNRYWKKRRSLVTTTC